MEMDLHTVKNWYKENVKKASNFINKKLNSLRKFYIDLDSGTKKKLLWFRNFSLEVLGYGIMVSFLWNQLFTSFIDLGFTPGTVIAWGLVLYICKEEIPDIVKSSRRVRR